MRRPKRGSTLVESAIVTTVFLTLLAGILQFGLIGFAYNSVCFAAHRAARFAAIRGNASGHPALTADVQAEALSYITCLDTTALTVTTTWTPDKNPGSTVQVNVAYRLTPFLVTVSSSAMTLQSTSRQIIVQ
ncbi:MAG: pilus assembly protein [Acidobacteriia bacterium]|nr:pilus assembly protein [Terriglobia bacterium]